MLMMIMYFYTLLFHILQDFGRTVVPSKQLQKYAFSISLCTFAIVISVISFYNDFRFSTE